MQRNKHSWVVKIRNTSEAVLGSQYIPWPLYRPRPYNSLGEYCGLTTASEVFLILVFSLHYIVSSAHLLKSLFTACPENWVTVGTLCLRLFTYYDRLTAARQRSGVPDVSYQEATRRCSQLGGVPAAMTPGVPAAMTPGVPAAMTPGVPAAMTPGVPAAMTPGVPAAMTPGVPAAMTPGVPAAMTPGVPAAMTPGVPAAMTPGVPAAMTPGVPAAMTPGVPAAMTPGVPAAMTPGVPQGVRSLLYLWRHSDLIGHIWVSKGSNNMCNRIEVGLDITSCFFGL